MQKRITKRRITCLFACLFFVFEIAAAAPLMEQAIEHVKQADIFLMEGEYSKAVKQYRNALAGGLVNADIYRNQSIALYELRLISDAIAAMKKAVELYPENELYRMELGILYVAAQSPSSAREMLDKVLRRNPGLAEAYFFLGEAFYQENRYTLAWFAAKIAEKLGFEASILIEKLEKVSEPPATYPWQNPGEELSFRRASFASRDDAETFLNKINQSELFEYLLEENDADISSLGGYAGEFTVKELQPQLIDAFKNQEPFSPPILFEYEEEFLVVQRLMVFDLAVWEKQIREENIPDLVADPFPKVVKFNRAEFSDVPLRQSTIDYSKIRIYAGSFLEEPSAVRQAMNLRSLAFPAFYLISENADNKILYNVVAGQYDTKKSALTACNELKKHGYSAFVSTGKKE
jgi:hypothetical protein